MEYPGMPYLFSETFPRGRGKFWGLEYDTESELPDEEYPFVLSTGRVLYHWHGGTLSRNSKIDEIWPEATVEIHPRDAEDLSVESGDWVALRSRRAEVQVRALVTGRSPQGLVFLPFHIVEAAAIVLTNDKTDPRAKIPDYKVCAVNVRPVEAPAGLDDGREIPLDHQGASNDQARLVQEDLIRGCDYEVCSAEIGSTFSWLDESGFSEAQCMH
jgi:predicted molibdopterin-dependent oxidoreductase YjgC